MAADETTEKSTGGGALIPQPHGGALKPGGTPGNKGGRTPSALRKMALRRGPKMLQVLNTIANDEKAKKGDRVAAAREMLRIGMGPTMSRDEVRDKLQATVMAAEAMLPEELAMRFVFEVRKIWLGH